MSKPLTSPPLDQNQYDYGLVVYDGFCFLCSGTVRFLLKIDRKKRLKFTTIRLQEEKATSDKNSGSSAPSTVIFIINQKIYSESEAIIRIFDKVGGVWKSANLFNVIPKKMRDSLYRYIARHRYKVFGKKNQCEVPPAKYADRFVPPIEIKDLKGVGMANNHGKMI